MIFRCKIFLLIITVLSIHVSYAIEVALTVDNSPYQGALPKNTSRMEIAKTILAALHKHHLTEVYGFINGYHANTVETQNILKLWTDSGQLLANHTYHHLSPARYSAEQYISDIKLNEPLLQTLMKKNDYKYFRYTFLERGNTKEKYNKIRKFLSDNNYKIAEITLDFSDFQWNDPYARCVAQADKASIDYLKKSYLDASKGAITSARSLSNLLFGRDIKYVMVIHMGAFDALMLDKMLTQYEKSGVKFISLSDALSDKIYRIDPGIISEKEYLLLDEIRMSRKLPNPPVVEQFNNLISGYGLYKVCYE